MNFSQFFSIFLESSEKQPELSDEQIFRCVMNLEWNAEPSGNAMNKINLQTLVNAAMNDDGTRQKIIHAMEMYMERLEKQNGSERFPYHPFNYPHFFKSKDRLKLLANKSPGYAYLMPR
jgi:hypothetical protein